ncbi:hypothetical protein NCCP2222_36660 [Sporosarcina sp. NCCP-2222]|uniref:hypothetical protein n=1 Tax=Sporosarcina sp. NCCP-2222 TaxID=2935073 RepID=UPI002088CCF3|nr:hypothetical protein [Sporosarcina sp. NCCP-2222]GKV57719.1 hypothetical protein NCCP2222_36660 [Sporosarcina sp. NCCP-2222]
MYDDVGVQLLLLDDEELFVKIMGISQNEITTAMTFNFDVLNKLHHPIALQFVEWTIEGNTFDISHEPFIIVDANSDVPRFGKKIKCSLDAKWNDSSFTVNVLHGITFAPIRTLEFNIQTVYKLLF